MSYNQPTCGNPMCVFYEKLHPADSAGYCQKYKRKVFDWSPECKFRIWYEINHSKKNP